MKVRIVAIFFTALLVSGVYGSSSAGGDGFEQTGLSASELQNLANALGALSGTIQSIQFLRSDGFSIDRAAILMEPRDGGWKILVFHLGKDRKFAPEWESRAQRLVCGKLQWRVSDAHCWNSRAGAAILRMRGPQLS